MSENKTRATETDVAAFLGGVAPDGKRADAERLDSALQRSDRIPAGDVGILDRRLRALSLRLRKWVAKATIWRPGFRPEPEISRSTSCPATPTSAPILDRLGKHKSGKSCLYFKGLSDIDENALRDLIRAGLEDLRRHWAVRPS